MTHPVLRLIHQTKLKTPSAAVLSPSLSLPSEPLSLPPHLFPALCLLFPYLFLALPLFSSLSSPHFFPIFPLHLSCALSSTLFSALSLSLSPIYFPLCLFFPYLFSHLFPKLTRSPSPFPISLTRTGRAVQSCLWIVHSIVHASKTGPSTRRLHTFSTQSPIS